VAAAVGGDGWATVGPLVFLALLITIGACIVAFFAWFVKPTAGNRCCVGLTGTASRDAV
jgi:hypothetical protein